MTRLTLIIALILGLGVLGSATAAPAPKATGGAGLVAGGVALHISFNAQGTLTDAKGQVQYKASNGNSFHGRVDCYNQAGNNATFSGVITKGEGTTASGYFLVNVTDNGEGDTATGPDLLRVQQSGAPFSCAAVEPGLLPITEGNIQVQQ